jgi:hypothetical protein
MCEVVGDQGEGKQRSGLVLSCVFLFSCWKPMNPRGFVVMIILMWWCVAEPKSRERRTNTRDFESGMCGLLSPFFFFLLMIKTKKTKQKR